MAETQDAKGRGLSRVTASLAVAAAVVAGLLVRGLSYDSTFLPDGVVILGIDDSMFHARRALYSFVNFPAILHFDHYMAYPDGVPAPVPPLFDWATAGIARLFGSETRTLEVVAAWVSPLSGALFAWPAYAIGSHVASRGVGVTAAWLCTLLPSGILITRVGNFDHHGAVALLAACWLWSSLACVERSGRALAARIGLQAVAIAAMLFTWSGSLLYLVLGSGAQLVALLWQRGRPAPLLAFAAAPLAAAIPVVLWLMHCPFPLGGAFSSLTLSWLHVLALLGLVASVLLLALWEWRRPSGSALARFSRLILVSASVGLPLLAVPGIRESLLGGLGFVAEQDEWAATNAEQIPLFHSSGVAASAAVRLGLFAYLVPLMPLYLGVLVVRSQEREKKLVLALWVSALTVLLLTQVRYGTDYTVPGAVVFSLLLRDLRSGLERWTSRSLATLGATGVFFMALVPPVLDFHWPAIRRAYVRMEQRDFLMGPREIAVRFGRTVREVTPETSGYLDAQGRPEYGILVPPTRGHLLGYTSRRPVPANNMGPYLDFEKYRLAREFYSTSRAERALEVADALGVQYVVTQGLQSARPTFSSFLHQGNDRSGRLNPSTGRFRLVGYSQPQGPKGRRRAPFFDFKLFEVVPGAVLVVDAEPREMVVAKLELRFRNARTSVYRTFAVSNEEGLARLRVPYATGQSGLVETGDAWSLRVSGRSISVRVSEADVREGREVRADGTGEGAPAGPT